MFSFGYISGKQNDITVGLYNIF